MLLRIEEGEADAWLVVNSLWWATCFLSTWGILEGPAMNRIILDLLGRRKREGRDGY